MYFIYTDVSSTQDLATNYFSKWGVPNECVAFRAFSQYQGMGRRGTCWNSIRGNIYLSILIPLPPRESYRTSLALIGTMCVVTLLKELGIPSLLKYPNDVLVNERKIAGVIGNIIHTEARVWCGILGIGLNVNYTPVLKDAAYSAVSLQELTNKNYDLERVTQRLLCHIKNAI